MKCLSVIIFVLLPINTLASVVINEIAWMGTTISYNDEWIELYNKTNSLINIDGWTLKAVDGSPRIELTGDIPANGFYLLERSKNYTGALENGGEILELYDNLGSLIDKVDASSGWPAGDNTTKQTMERTNSYWQTSQNPGGTPRAKNSTPSAQEPMREELLQPAEKLSVKPSLTESPSSKPSLTNNEQFSENPNTFPFAAIAIPLSLFNGAVILILKRRLNV